MADIVIIVGIIGSVIFGLRKVIKTKVIKPYQVTKVKNIDYLINNCCSICLENYIINDKIATLGCDHQYHKKCIKKWFRKKNTCPICRFNVYSIV